MGRIAGGGLTEKSLRTTTTTTTKSVYINDISASTWNKFIGLTKMLDVNQTPAVEEALQLYIDKHKREIDL